MVIVNGAVFARCIDAYCTINGISKEQLYKETDISSANLAQWRAGSNPSQKKVVAFERYSGIPAEQFIEMWSGKAKPATENGDGMSEKDVRLLAWFRSLPKEKQKAILTFSDAPEDLL